MQRVDVVPSWQGGFTGTQVGKLHVQTLLHITGRQGLLDSRWALSCCSEPLLHAWEAAALVVSAPKRLKATLHSCLQRLECPSFAVFTRH